MNLPRLLPSAGFAAFFLCAAATGRSADGPSPPVPLQTVAGDNAQIQNWNWHVQNTDVAQATPGFAAQYSGPNSLDDHG
jgi:hypothetical protein